MISFINDSPTHCHFFFPEIKDHLSEERKKQIETEILKENENNFTNFDEKRQIGENSSYLCELIRQDNIEDFIVYINQYNLSFAQKVLHSIFETNRFLLKNEPMLIEYAAFFGSVQIFHYLLNKNAQMNHNLWSYAIHSLNPEIIDKIEGIEAIKIVDFEMRLKILKESIKCHHNSIYEYIKSNFFKENEQNQIQEKIDIFSIHYHNYQYLPSNLNQSDLFFYYCKYFTQTVVDLYFTVNKKRIDQIVIQKSI